MKDYLVPICASLSYLGLCPQTLFNAQTNTSLLFSYDYIIAGGGLSGLVVATRLTEDPTSKSLHAFLVLNINAAPQRLS